MINNSFKKLRVDIEEVLKSNILAYWEKYSVDELNGGFVGHVNFDNSVEEKANKGLILNTRLLWTFSIAANELHLDKYKQLAKRAYEYLRLRFKDDVYGGVYWDLSYNGRPVECKKQVYGQAFAIYALTEYYKCSVDSKALDWAIELFQLIEKYSFDEQYGGYIEAFERDWSGLQDMRLSEKDVNLEKTMNTHLHILEAYSSLYSVWPDPELKEQLQLLIQVFLHHFLNENYHLNLFFNKDWTKVGDTISFGHDIECAWLLTKAAKVINDNALLVLTRNEAIGIANQFIIEAIDYDGGIMNERFGVNGEYDRDKHWWIQAEALVGLMDAYSITGSDKFTDAIHKVWSFISEYMIDYQNGEWYWKVNRNGKPYTNMEKIGFWKCPYHNSRACLEMMKRIDEREIVNI
jgi:mannobiose 2-epimerase